MGPNLEHDLSSSCPGTVEVRCPSRIQFRVENGQIEMACHSKRCGAGNGVVVLHYYNEETYEFIRTVKFKNPEALFRKETDERTPGQ